MSAADEEESSWLEQARSGWLNRGDRRPAFALEPAPGQESAWDYPRPPAIVVERRLVIIGDPEHPLVSTDRSLRVLETASPPTFYFAAQDVRTERLVVAGGSSFCEWKGPARFWALREQPDQAIAWSYPEPLAGFETIAGHLSFYPDRIRCEVEGEVVRPQAGGFYGGWITDKVVGPFKGDPGTSGW
ncbi:MAG: DUF427 domain-containing protein [Actinomycetota bacterium]|nr:DUF427 domain-containing protein [Actinomycetota bacterium]